MRIEDGNLGHAYNSDELLNQTHAIWGGVAWPSERPGYAVIVGAGTQRRFDAYDIHVMAEFECENTRDLVRQCAALNVKYSIPRPRTHERSSCGRWIGDYKDDAADTFIREVNDEIRPGTHTPRFHLNSTLILDMERVYPYIIPQIQTWIDPKRRCLFLHNAKVADSLNELDWDMIDDLELGAYPAIEALAFVVIEMRRWIAQQEAKLRQPKRDAYAGFRIHP